MINWEETKKQKSVSSVGIQNDTSKFHKTLRTLFSDGTTAVSLSPQKQYIFALLSLFLLTCVVYFPATNAGFVWDDSLIGELRAISIWEGIWQFWFDPITAYTPEGRYREGHYWPLLYTTFWIEHKLWGFSPKGYHIVNILIHFANTTLLYYSLRRLSVPGTWFAAAIFAVHPLHAEPVAWIMARKDSLSTLFCLASLALWLRYRDSQNLIDYAGSLLLFVAAMLCKPVVVVFPATMIIIQWWEDGNISQAFLLRVAPFFLLGFAIAIADMLFYQKIQPVSFDHSIIERVLIASQSFWFYVSKLFWPTELAVIYPHWDVSVTDPLDWLYFIAVVVLVATVWLLRHRLGRGPLACALFFGIMLLPVLGFIDYGYMTYSFVADRYQYLASTGVIVLFASAFWYFGSVGIQRLVKKVVCLALLAFLGVAAWNHTSIFKDEITFFKHVISINPQAHTAHLNLAHALLYSGEKGPREALPIAREAVRQQPNYYNPHSVLGVVLSALGQHQEAEKHLYKSIKLNPGHVPTYLALAEHFRRRKHYKKALKLYEATIKINPGSSLSYVGIGYTLFSLKRYEETVSNLKHALSLNPYLDMAPTIHNLIGRALLNIGGRRKEAKWHLRHAKRLAHSKTP